MFRAAAITAHQFEFAPRLSYRSPSVFRYFYGVSLGVLSLSIWVFFFLPISDSRAFNGTVLAGQPSVEIRAARSGYVSGVSVRPANYVHSGESIVSVVDQALFLQATPFRARVEHLSRRRHQSNAQLQQHEQYASMQRIALEDEVTHLIEQAETLSARREVALSNYQIASGRYRQYQHLYHQGSASRNELDDAYAHLGLQLNQVAISVSELNAINHRIRERERAELEINASLHKARLDYVDAIDRIHAQEIDLSEHQLMNHASPISGRLDQLLVREGQWVERGALLAMVRPTESSVRVRTYVDLSIARRLHEGDPVKLRYQRFEHTSGAWQHAVVQQVGVSPIQIDGRPTVAVDLLPSHWVDQTHRQINDGDDVEVLFQLHRKTGWAYMRDRFVSWGMRL